MVFNFRKKPINKQPAILEGSNLDFVESHKYLGVTIQITSNEQLCWKSSKER